MNRIALAAVSTLALTASSLADFATLIDSTTIIDNIPIGTIGGEDGFGSPHFAVNRGDGINSGFIDAAVLLYDFGGTTGVSSATLTLDIDTIWAEDGLDPTIELFTYGDSDTIIQLTDINLGAGTVRDSFQYTRFGSRVIDVTAAVNDALATSQFVGFRFQNERSPFELPNVLEGIHYNPISLEFEPGGFSLGLSGFCPGQITASASGATSGGTVAFIFASGTGSVTIPSGVCAGTQLGLNGSAQLIGTATANANGDATISGNAPAVACGGFVQALDVSTCTPSNVEGL